MTELTIKIEDKSLLPMLRKLINSLPGVSLSKPARRKKCGLDEAYEDVAAGRVTRVNDVDEIFSNILGI